MRDTHTQETESVSWSVRAALLTIVVFFGGSLPAYKLASRSFGPATTNLIRFSIASVFMCVLARRHLRTVWRTQREVVVPLLLTGTFGLGLMAALMSVGVDRGSATVASIVVGLEPIGVALAGVFLVGDRSSRRMYVALGVGFVGAVVASGIFTEREGSRPILPMLLLLGTVITFSMYTAEVRKLRGSIPALAVAAITQTGALLLIIPALLFDILDNGMRRGPLTGKSLLGLTVLGIGSAIAYLLLCSVLASQPSSRVAVSMYLTPLFGVLFSWLIVGEDLHVRDGVGAAIVLLAIWISEQRG